MKKPSLLTTGLAFASSLFVAAVALSTVTPHQAKAGVLQSAQAQTSVAPRPDPFFATAVTRLMRQGTLERPSSPRSSVG